MRSVEYGGHWGRVGRRAGVRYGRGRGSAVTGEPCGRCAIGERRGAGGAVGEWGVGAIIRCRTVCAEHKNKAAVRQPCSYVWSEPPPLTIASAIPRAARIRPAHPLQGSHAAQRPTRPSFIPRSQSCRPSPHLCRALAALTRPPLTVPRAHRPHAAHRPRRTHIALAAHRTHASPLTPPCSLVHPPFLPRPRTCSPSHRPRPQRRPHLHPSSVPPSPHRGFETACFQFICKAIQTLSAAYRT